MFFRSDGKINLSNEQQEVVAVEDSIKKSS
jgi:hypothetical protein